MLNVESNGHTAVNETSPYIKKKGATIIDSNDKAYKPSELVARCEKLVEENILPSLEDFVRIPNLSRNFDKDFLTNGLLEKACQHVLDWSHKQGVKNMTLEMYKCEGRTPLIYGEVPATEGVTNSMLMYGHIDKQPHLDADWDEGLSAIEPVRKGDYIYGRGISDDGYAPYASISIVKLLQEQGLPHPKFIFFFECDEESGSVDIEYWIHHFRKEMGSPDMFVCLDSGCFDYENWYLTSTLRGACSFEITVETMAKGVHSGSGGGVIPDTYRIMNQIISRLEDPVTGKIIEELAVQIPGKVYLDCEKVCNIIGDSFVKSYAMNQGVKPMSDAPFENYLNRSQRPSLTVIGIDHVPACINGGNVIRPRTTVKLNMRLPPTLSLDKAKKVISEKVLSDSPYGATITMEWGMLGQGFFAPIMPGHVEDLLNESAREAFNNNEVLFNHEGGSIPFMNILREKFPKSLFMVTGLLGPGSNAHAGNENIHVPTLKKLIHGMTKFTQKLAHLDFDFNGDKRPRGKSSKI